MGKCAIITGATAGIGKATSHLLAREGYDLILCGRRKERLLALANELQLAHKVAVHIFSFDIRNRSEVEQAVKAMGTLCDQVDVLINNAGLAAGLDQIQDGDPDDWDQMIDTNVKGLLYISRQIIPWMIKNGAGHVVNIGSIAGKEVYPNGNVYCGTKHMVDALNKSMRRELAEHNIRVSSINPGAVETEFSLVRLKWDEDKAHSVYDGFENLVADDIADAIWFVLSRPSHVNINEIVIMPKAQPAAGVIIRNKGL
jgi:NADP-dependent 3-hydroxy acid dehydrogenase YdfG